MASSSATKKVVVAVDFGTTFSGFAWAQTSDPSRHYLINQWPRNSTGAFDGMTSEKVPSEIAYEYEESGPNSLWGFQIHNSMPRMQLIKLGLDPDQKRKLSSRLSLNYTDPRDTAVPYHSSPEEVVSDFLQHLPMPCNSFFTVPAIWSERAKVATLKCAEAAGFGAASEIRINSEPEAAAIHALRASNPHGLEIGDTIVLCDAGGGTVDLITFSIIELEPTLRLKEEAPGGGSLCGSTFLNRRFEELLEDRLSFVPGWGHDTLEDAMQRFETVAKRTFSSDTKDNCMIPVPGIADEDSIGVKRGRFRLTGCKMAKLFLPVLEEVHFLVKSQVRTSKSKVKAIFLVGGFGQSPYLRKYLQDSLAPDIEVLTPSDGWTAVVRGALMKTLGEITSSALQTSIESRVARKKYGTTKAVPFKKGLHDEKKKRAAIYSYSSLTHLTIIDIEIT